MEAAASTILRLDNGSSVDLGPRATILTAADEIIALTGGSSGGGRWSYLSGLLNALGAGDEQAPLGRRDVRKIASEARDFQKQVAGQISNDAKRLLDDLRKLRRKEEELQRWIADTPSLLGVAEPAAVAEEARMPGAGRADVIVVDKSGMIAIVECKLAKNPELRRWVIGQLFSYAASLWKLGYKDLERVFRACGASLTQHVPENELDAFSDRVRENLTHGEFRLIIAVDEISDELERTVTYINALARPEIDFSAFALRDGDGDDDGGSRPTVEEVGKDADAIQPLRPKWKRDKFLDALPSDDARRVADHLLSWAEDRAPQVDSDKATDGVVATCAGATLFRIKDHRYVRVSLRALTADGESTIEQEIRRGLVEVDARFGADRSPLKAPLEALLGEDKRKQFLDLMQQYLEALTS